MKKILASLFVVLVPFMLDAQRQRFTTQVQELSDQDNDEPEETEQDEEERAQERKELVKPDRTLLARWKGPNDYLRCFIVDTVDVWKSLFTKSSMHVLSAIIPTYLATRQANYVIHKHFYRPVTHENVKQPPKFLSEIAIADAIVAIPFLALNMYGWWFGRDPLEFRRVQVFNAGLISTWVAKLILKELKHHDAYRPWSGEFSSDEQACNGWPSGHSAMIAYLATFWGLEKGYKWGVPFGIFTLYAMAINVVTNHHYLSQTFVGAGLGLLFGVSAHKVMGHIVKDENFSVGMGTSHYGKPALRLAYDF